MMEIHVEKILKILAEKISGEVLTLGKQILPTIF